MENKVITTLNGYEVTLKADLTFGEEDTRYMVQTFEEGKGCVFD